MRSSAAAPSGGGVGRRLAAQLTEAAFRIAATGRDRLRASYHEDLHTFIRSQVAPGSRVLDVGCGDGTLLSILAPTVGVGLDNDPHTLQSARARHPHLRFVEADLNHVPDLGSFDYVVVSGTLGRVDDVWACLRSLRRLVCPSGRLIVTYYNFAWEPILKLAERLQLKIRAPGQNWLGIADLTNLVQLAHFEPILTGYRNPLPLSRRPSVVAMSRRLADLPLTRRAGITSYIVAAPVDRDTERSSDATCTVVIPARNERGNIRAAVERLPQLGSATQIVFVEGHSTDGTADEIRQVIEERSDLDVSLVDQGEGAGKAHAVRKGFEMARGDVLMILDADLTVPPEDLPKFWAAICEGRGDFINGTRMVYPMEQQAMRLANLAANKVFGVVFTWILGQRVTDTLCGTKALWADDYERIRRDRHVFGDCDPFGDFDLLFGAAHLGLTIREVPIRYRERTYGTTQISRWRHGVLLLKMTVRGARKLRFGGRDTRFRRPVAKDQQLD